MTNDGKGTPNRPFDLEERTAKFGEAAVGFAKRIPVTPVTESIIRQLVRSSTSIGANYCEADDAGSRKEFLYRISLCKREARETKYWLRVLASAGTEWKEEARALWREAKELHLIFAKIHRGKKKD